MPTPVCWTTIPANLRNRAAHNAEITVTDALRFDELARRMKKFLDD